MADQETITITELAQALIRMGDAGKVSSVRIYENIKAHREPDWKAGDVVVDAHGLWWRKTNVKDGWYRFGYPNEHDRKTPKRPLKLMGRENI